MKKQVIRIVAGLFLLSFFGVASGQVDGSKSASDTLYLYEEEVVYDTLYLYDTLPQTLLTKEELIAAFRQNRGVGHLYREKGGLYLTGDEETYRLSNADLRELFSPAEYAEWQKSRRALYGSIPLYVVGAGGVAVAGLGLYQFAASFVATAKYRDQLLDSDDLGVQLWRCAMGGTFLFAGGMVAAIACFAPAVVLTVKGKVRANHVIRDFNQSSTTALRLNIAPAPCGVGVSVLF